MGRAGAAAEGAPDKHPERIAGMFDRIARRYDLLNHLLSGGLDLYWRRRAVRALRLAGRERVLDVCAGTADVMIAALRAEGRGARYAVGVDFAHEMLRIGHRKLDAAALASRSALVRGDAMALPVAGASVEAATIAFGIRNVLEPRKALADILRCLRPGGQLAILEFAMPTAPLLRALYAWYFRHVLPRIGALVSRHDEAYRYLPESVGTFHAPAEFQGLLNDSGFQDVRAVPLSFGVVYLYVARKAVAGGPPAPPRH
jgi:demethylmenaquinone methyltransferase/2-methoxy-6-polyprenyl-1,4-benzoquinol methylase